MKYFGFDQRLYDSLETYTSPTGELVQNKREKYDKRMNSRTQSVSPRIRMRISVYNTFVCVCRFAHAVSVTREKFPESRNRLFGNGSFRVLQYLYSPLCRTLW